MDPRGLRELVPDFEKTAPLDTPVTQDAAYLMTSRNAWKLPVTPAPLRNHGNYVVSLNRLVKWLGTLAEKAGVNIFTQSAGAELIHEGGGIAGVITDDKGLDKNEFVTLDVSEDHHLPPVIETSLSVWPHPCSSPLHTLS
jgi:electron-transferring-flavoprotein dehydrogenase